MSQRRRLLQKQNRNVRDQFRLWTKISGIFWNILSFLLSTVHSGQYWQFLSHNKIQILSYKFWAQKSRFFKILASKLVKKIIFGPNFLRIFLLWDQKLSIFPTVTSLGSQNSRIPPPIFQIALNVFSCFSTSLKQHQDLPFDIIIECVRDPRLHKSLWFYFVEMLRLT